MWWFTACNQLLLKPLPQSWCINYSCWCISFYFYLISVVKHSLFRYDDSLWHRVDMTKSNLLPGLLGKVLKRGTRVLRIAHAKVTAGVQVFMSMIFLQLHLMYSFSNILWTCCFRLFLINNILMSLLQVASPLCDDNAPFFLDVVPLSPKSPRLVFSRSTHM